MKIIRCFCVSWPTPGFVRACVCVYFYMCLCAMPFSCRQRERERQRGEQKREEQLDQARTLYTATAVETRTYLSCQHGSSKSIFCNDDDDSCLLVIQKREKKKRDFFFQTKGEEKNPEHVVESNQKRKKKIDFSLLLCRGRGMFIVLFLHSSSGAERCYSDQKNLMSFSDYDSLRYAATLIVVSQSTSKKKQEKKEEEECWDATREQLFAQ